MNMEIERHELPRATIDEFAEKHGLVMEIHERSHVDGPARWYAHFKHAELSEPPFLRGVFGDGYTPAEAVEEYAKEISGRVLIIDAYSEQRKELVVPILVTKGGE